MLEHTAKENIDELERHPAEAMKYLAFFPLLAALGMFLVEASALVLGA